MRHVSGVLVAGGQSGGGSIWLWSVVLACCLEAALLPAVVAEDIAPVAPISRSDAIDDNPQVSIKCQNYINVYKPLKNIPFLEKLNSLHIICNIHLIRIWNST